MSIFAKIRGAKKAADEHRKSKQLQERDVPKAPYRHVPTHAQTDALRIVQPNDEVLRDQIKEQHRRRSELGPSRTGSDLLTSHAVYRRQNSTTSLGDISIASMLLQPPPANSLPPLKPIHPSKMNNYRYSGFNPSSRNRSGFTTSASAPALSKGKSPLSTMTSSLNELPEEGLQADSPIESSKQSTKSLSSSSSEGLEIRYSTPGQSVVQTSAPHTRATSVASRADSPKSRKPLQTDMQQMDEPQRSKSPVHVFPSPIPESTSPKVFDAELEAVKSYNVASDRLADQRMSTPISHISTITPTANSPTPKRSDEEWFMGYSSQHSTPTPRRGGKNFSRPTFIQDPNPPRLELPIEQDGHFERLALEIPPELISVGHVSTRDAQIQRPPINDRQSQQSRQPQQFGQTPQFSQNNPIQYQAYNTPRPPHTHTKPRQESYEIPYPQFSPRDTISTEQPTLRGPHSNYSQRRISHQQPMQSQQHDYIPLQSIQASHRQLEDDLEHERKQTYRQLSANDPYQHEMQSFETQGNSQIAYQDAAPIPMTSKHTSRMKSPTIRPITYTQGVTPVVSDSQRFETTSPTASLLISPTRIPMTSPARSPVINPVRDHSRLVGIFGRVSSNTQEKNLPPRTESPQQSQSINNKNEDKRKSRSILKRGKKGSIKAF